MQCFKIFKPLNQNWYLRVNQAWSANYFSSASSVKLLQNDIKKDGSIRNKFSFNHSSQGQPSDRKKKEMKERSNQPLSTNNRKSRTVQNKFSFDDSWLTGDSQGQSFDRKMKMKGRSNQSISTSSKKSRTIQKKFSFDDSWLTGSSQGQSFANKKMKEWSNQPSSTSSVKSRTIQNEFTFDDSCLTGNSQDQSFANRKESSMEPSLPTYKPAPLLHQRKIFDKFILRKNDSSPTTETSDAELSSFLEKENDARVEAEEEKTKLYSVEENLSNLKDDCRYFKYSTMLVRVFGACSGVSKHPDDADITIDALKKDPRFHLLMKLFIRCLPEYESTKFLTLTKYFHYLSDPEVCNPDTFNFLLELFRNKLSDVSLEHCIHLVFNIEPLCEKFPAAKCLVRDVCHLMEDHLNKGNFRNILVSYLPVITLFIDSEYWSVECKTKVIDLIRERSFTKPLPFDMTIRYFKVLLDGMMKSSICDQHIFKRATIRLIRTIDKDTEFHEAARCVDMMGVMVDHALIMDDRLIHFIHEIITVDVCDLYFLKFYQHPLSPRLGDMTREIQLKLVAEAGVNLAYLGYDPVRIVNLLNMELSRLSQQPDTEDICQDLKDALDHIILLKPDKIVGLHNFDDITDHQLDLLIHAPWKFYFALARGDRFTLESEIVKDYIQHKDCVVSTVLKHLDLLLKDKFSISKFNLIDGVVYDIVMEVLSSNRGLEGHKIGLFIKTSMEEYVPNPFLAVSSHLTNLPGRDENFHFAVFEYNKWNSIAAKASMHNIFMWKFLNALFRKMITRANNNCINERDFVD